MSPPSPRVSDRIHAALRRDILDGRLLPGAAVASERALAEEHGANRHAVREALKRLEQAGLVAISQGGATRVLDWRECGGLEVLLDLLAGEAGAAAPPVELARSVLEMRESIGVDAARRCAVRAPDATRAEISRLADAVEGALDADGGRGGDREAGRGEGGGGRERGSAARADEHYAALWLAVVAGSGNIAYRLALNSLVAALAAYAEIAEGVRPRDPGRVRALASAIGACDPEAAERAARDLLAPDTRLFD